MCNCVTASGFFGVRGPWPFGLGVPLVPPQRLDTRRGQGPLRLVGPPDAPLVRAGNAVWGLACVLQGRQGRRGDPLVARRQRPLRAQGVVSTALGIRLQPRGDAVAMDAEPRGALLAVACLAAGRQRQGREPRSLLAVPCAVHAALQLVGACGHAWHRFAPLQAPPLDG